MSTWANAWREFMQSLRLTEGQSSQRWIPTDADLDTFEQEHHFVLPKDYREFCKLFGSGVAGNRLRIFCPGSRDLLIHQEGVQTTINHIREFPSGNDEVDDQKINLLSNGFWITDDRAAYFLMWDLRTYQEEDSSYDLYWALWDGPESENLESDFKFVGRSFFEFIRDFCYGSRVLELYPSEEYCGQVTNTYNRF